MNGILCCRVAVGIAVAITAWMSSPPAMATVDSMLAPAGSIGGAPVSGALGPIQEFPDKIPSDADWWTLSVAAKTQLKVTAAFGAGCGGREGTADIGLADYLDNEIRDARMQSKGWAADGSGVGEITWTTPDRAEPMFVVVYGTQDGCTYQLSVTPTASLIPSLFPVYPTESLAEPKPMDDTKEQARGPLRAGVTYTGTGDSNNDPDWVFFRARHDALIDVYAESAGTCADGLPTDFSMERQASPGDRPNAFNQGQWGIAFDRSVPSDIATRRRIRFKAVGGSVYLRLFAAVGCPWQIRVLPAAAVVPPTATGCRRARRDLRSVDRRLQKAREALHFKRTKSKATYRRRAERVRRLSRLFDKTAIRVQEQCE